MAHVDSCDPRRFPNWFSRVGLARLFDYEAWRYCLPYFRNSRGRLLFFIAATSIQSLLVLPVLYLIRAIFDQAIPSGNMQLLLWIGVGILTIRLVMGCAQLVLRRFILRIVKDAIHQMRCDNIEKVYTLSQRWHGIVDRERVHTQLVMDTERVDVMVNALFSNILPAAVTGLAIICVLFTLNWFLVLASMAVMPLVWFGARLTGKIVKREVNAFQRAFETFSSGVYFVLNQVDLTRVQGYETAEANRQKAHSRALRDQGVRMAMSYAISGQVHKNLSGIASLMILVLGGASIATGNMSLGDFMAFYVAANLLNFAIDAVLGGLPQLITGNESLVTLNRVMNDDDIVPYAGIRKVELADCVELRDVVFGYTTTRLLDRVSLKIERGANLAIVGSNGAGKTTLINLLLGFIRPQQGGLFADGLEYEQIDMQHLRRLIGVVPQNAKMFSGTIFENISYGVDDASMSQVVAAAELSMADDFIQTLPDGYRTQIGQEGVRLSGGQRQRIALARAMLGSPRLLILDEPTNHLDAEAVEQLISRLLAWPDRPAMVTISHNTSVLNRMERVFRLENGRLTCIRSSSQPAQRMASTMVPPEER